jgi:hypothetical protein
MAFLPDGKAEAGRVKICKGTHGWGCEFPYLASFAGNQRIKFWTEKNRGVIRPNAGAAMLRRTGSIPFACSN